MEPLRYVSTYDLDVGKHAIRSSAEKMETNRIGSLCTGHYIYLDRTFEDAQGDTWAVVDARSHEEKLVEEWEEEWADESDEERELDALELPRASARHAAAIALLEQCFVRQVEDGKASVFICVAKGDTHFLIPAEEDGASVDETDDEFDLGASVEEVTADADALAAESEEFTEDDGIHDASLAESSLDDAAALVDAADAAAAEVDDLNESSPAAASEEEGDDDDEGELYPGERAENAAAEVAAVAAAAEIAAAAAAAEIAAAAKEQEEEPPVEAVAPAEAAPPAPEDAPSEAKPPPLTLVPSEAVPSENAMSGGETDAPPAEEERVATAEEEEDEATASAAAAAARVSVSENAVAQMAAKASGAYDIDALLAAGAGAGINPFGAAEPAAGADIGANKAWDELVQSKDWKERKAGYGALEALLLAESEGAAPASDGAADGAADGSAEDASAAATEAAAAARPLLKGIAKERMAGAQEAGYKALAALFARAEAPLDGSAAAAVAAALVSQGLASRSSTHAQGALLALMRTRAEAGGDEHGGASTPLIKLGLKSRNTKLVAKALDFALHALTTLRSESGAPSAACLDELRGALSNKALLAVLDTHKLPGVRQQAKALRALLDVGAASRGAASGASLSGGARAAAASGGADAPGGGGARAAAAAQPDAATTPLPERIRSAFRKAKSPFAEKLKSAKWKERRDALDRVAQMVAATPGSPPTLADGDYDQIVRALVAVVVKDGNVAVTSAATQLLTAVATGMAGKKSFAHAAKLIVLGVLKRMKDRKTSLRNALGELLDAAATSAVLKWNDVEEKITAAATDSKKPEIQRGVVDWCARCVVEGAPARAVVFADADATRVLFAVHEGALEAKHADVRAVGAAALTALYGASAASALPRSAKSDAVASQQRCGERVAAMVAPPASAVASKVSFLLCTVTFYANLAHS